MLLSLDRLMNARAFVVPNNGGCTEASNGLTLESRRGPRTGQMRMRVAQELGEVSVAPMPSKAVEGSPQAEAPGLWAKASRRPEERKHRDAGWKWYRRVKETKRGETGSEKS